MEGNSKAGKKRGKWWLGAMQPAAPRHRQGVEGGQGHCRWPMLSLFLVPAAQGRPGRISQEKRRAGQDASAKKTANQPNCMQRPHNQPPFMLPSFTCG